jgi:hypothetical protein
MNPVSTHIDNCCRRQECDKVRIVLFSYNCIQSIKDHDAVKRIIIDALSRLALERNKTDCNRGNQSITIKPFFPTKSIFEVIITIDRILLWYTQKNILNLSFDNEGEKQLLLFDLD